MMRRVATVLVFLIGLAAFGWGGALVALGLVGESAAPRHVEVRRIGGERDEATPNRYTYSIGYEFVTRDGVLVSGHAQAIGDSTAAKSPRRIRYLAAMPRINAPEDHCGVAGYPLTLLGTGAVLGWATLRPRRTAQRAAPPTRRPCRPVSDTSANPAIPPGSRDPDAARAWLRRYRRHARLYAWSFVVVVAAVVGTIIRVELGAWSREWFYATGFAAGLTWVLALYSRRQAESTWSGVVVSRELREVQGRGRSGAGHARMSHIIHVRTDAGRSRKVRVGAALFEVYREGMRVRKVAGLTYPLPDIHEDHPPFCPVCGGLHDEPAAACRRCRAPVFRSDDMR